MTPTQAISLIIISMWMVGIFTGVGVGIILKELNKRGWL
jgi:hypothetical protein